MEMTDSSSEDPEAEVASDVIAELESQEPSPSEKDSLRREHRTHLVRKTTSKLTLHPDTAPGIEVDAEVEVPDTYCFTCSEWIGLSGVDLRGTPRSRTDAFYLGEKPSAVRAAEHGTQETIRELADALIDRVEHLNTRADSFDFITMAIEQMDETESDNPDRSSEHGN